MNYEKITRFVEKITLIVCQLERKTYLCRLFQKKSLKSASFWCLSVVGENVPNGIQESRYRNPIRFSTDIPLKQVSFR